jgi:hypothetical protein
LSTGGFVPNSMLDATTVNPNVDNIVVCHNFTAVANTTKHFDVDNSPPPGGSPRTIGYWKNWASCAPSSLNKAPILDRTLAKAETSGIVVSAGAGGYPSFGSPYWLVLHGSTSTPDKAPDCLKAYRLLDKSSTNNGKKQSGDPAFNLAAQLVGAELNYVAGAKQTAATTQAITDAVRLLGKYHFDGTGYDGKISAADKATMLSLADLLDKYNNSGL